MKSFWSQWKQDAGWRVMLEQRAEMVRGHPINPQQAASYPLYKVIFLVPALSRVRAPSKFPTIDRTTPDHCYDQSTLVLVRKTQYEFHVSINFPSRARVKDETGQFTKESYEDSQYSSPLKMFLKFLFSMIKVFKRRFKIYRIILDEE